MSSFTRGPTESGFSAVYLVVNLKCLSECQILISVFGYVALATGGQADIFVGNNNSNNNNNNNNNNKTVRSRLLTCWFNSELTNNKSPQHT